MLSVTTRSTSSPLGNSGTAISSVGIGETSMAPRRCRGFRLPLTSGQLGGTTPSRASAALGVSWLPLRNVGDHGNSPHLLFLLHIKERTPHSRLSSLVPPHPQSGVASGTLSSLASLPLTVEKATPYLPPSYIGSLGASPNLTSPDDVRSVGSNRPTRLYGHSHQHRLLPSSPGCQSRVPKSLSQPYRI